MVLLSAGWAENLSGKPQTVHAFLRGRSSLSKRGRRIANPPQVSNLPHRAQCVTANSSHPAAIRTLPSVMLTGERLASKGAAGRKVPDGSKKLFIQFGGRARRQLQHDRQP